MKYANLIQLVIICMGILIGMFLSHRSTKLHQQMEHPLAVQTTHMDHGLMDISKDSIIPKVTSLEVTKDAMSGWNISLETTNFTFTPAQVNTDHVPGQGHAHIYVNGEKFARLYGSSFHLPKLAAQLENIRVTLNANGHETLAIGEEAIEIKWQNQ